MVHTVIPKHIDTSQQFCNEMGAVTGQSTEELFRALARQRAGYALKTNLSYQGEACDSDEERRQEKMRHARAANYLADGVQNKISYLTNDDGSEQTFAQRYEQEQKGPCQVGITKEGHDINGYFSGGADKAPPALEELGRKHLAEKLGIKPEAVTQEQLDGLTKEDYKIFFQKEYPNADPDIISSKPLKLTESGLKDLSLRKGETVLDRLRERGGTKFGSSEKHWDTARPDTQPVNPEQRLSANPGFEDKKIAPIGGQFAHSVTAKPQEPQPTPTQAPGQQMAAKLEQKLAIDKFQPAPPTQSA